MSPRDPDLSYIAPDLRAIAVPIDSLQPDPENAREHSDEQVADLLHSIKLYGQQRAIVAKDGIVRAGSGVLLAMRLGGYQFVAVSRTDLPEDKLDAFAIADNRLAERSTWNPDKLAAAVERAKSRGLDPTKDLGLNRFEVNKLLARLKPVEEPAAEPAPEAGVAPRTKPGDVWRMGSHRLKCGDSFNPEDLADLTAGDVADCALTDPPFAIYGSSTGIGRDIADDKMVRPFFENLFRNLTAHVKEFGHVYVHCDWRSWAPIWEAAKRSGLGAKNCLVWDKGDFGMGTMFGNAHEFVGFFVKTPPAAAMVSSERRGNRTVGSRCNMLRFPRVTHGEREHNAAKPVAMLEELLTLSTEPGESVLDLFGGSGSTLIAAEKSGRSALVMEMEPRWCDVIVARWERHTGGKAERLAPPTTA